MESAYAELHEPPCFTVGKVYLLHHVWHRGETDTKQFILQKSG